jgi:hypothetical protein
MTTLALLGCITTDLTRALRRITRRSPPLDPISAGHDALIEIHTERQEAISNYLAWVHDLT